MGDKSQCTHIAHTAKEAVNSGVKTPTAVVIFIGHTIGSIVCIKRVFYCKMWRNVFLRRFSPTRPLQI